MQMLEETMKNKELKVVYTNDFKSKIKVKPIEVKPEELVKEKYDRAKKKAKDRKLAEEYLDR